MLYVCNASEWESGLSGASLEGRGGRAMFLAGCSARDATSERVHDTSIHLAGRQGHVSSGLLS